MNGVLVMYKVKDFGKWDLNVEEGAGYRRTLGSKSANVYNKVNNQKRAKNRRTIHSKAADVIFDEDIPSELVVLYNWDDLDKAREYFESEEFKNQIQDAGVEEDPEIYYLEDVSRLVG